MESAHTCTRKVECGREVRELIHHVGWWNSSGVSGGEGVHRREGGHANIVFLRLS